MVASNLNQSVLAHIFSKEYAEYGIHVGHVF